MQITSFILQFIDILLYSWLTLIMIRRVLCRGLVINHEGVSWIRLKALFIRKHYWSDIILLLGSVIAVCKLTNDFMNNSIANQPIIRSIQWLLFHKCIAIGLLVKFRKSQPEIILHLLEDFSEYTNNLKNKIKHGNFNNFWKRWFKTSS